ncbi:biotin-dependent carboxyltransferase family protein [Lacimicrobium alkaliphilum]|uniref:Allophanate hydrolase n=1 Tax=Lacimicrobium alkaliphilum TaxID=1526571 RepID=A0A0U3AP63_9ALTE|nr:biotin-dependent carboxyltransferase family protein [Lacimicrobium alkaliphilum]ALS99714.1 allophanate hydrolase [Lacimicrobium alkaliphilum]
MNEFVIENPGLLSLLTDCGRFGQAHLGLTTGGPMDPFAFNLANALVGNSSNTTLIETTLGGLSLKTGGDCLIAVTGAVTDLKIDNKTAPLWQSHKVKRDQTIELGQPQQGLRNYIAVSGGFGVDPEFGSTSTVLREGIGGLGGTRLQQGDKLAVGQSAASTRCRSLPESAIPDYGTMRPLRLVTGYQFTDFPLSSRQRFFTSEYNISAQADRMGYRLSGPAISSGSRSMLSEGIALGAVQVPADGQPIVLLNDRQTIGGYPKLGSVLSSDCALLAQWAPGTKISFEPVSIEQAHNLLHLHHARLVRILQQLEHRHE